MTRTTAPGPSWPRGALCRFVWNTTLSFRQGGRERVSGQMREPGQPQVGNGDEVLARAKAPRGALGLLQQPVHGLDEGVAAVIGHAAHHRAEALLDGGGEFLEWFEPTAPGPAQPVAQIAGGVLGVVVRPGARIDLAQRHLQPPRPRALERGALQPVHRVELPGAPARGVLAHGPHQALDRLAFTVAKRRVHRSWLVAHLRTSYLILSLIHI